MFFLSNAEVEQCPKGICLELLVLPAAERRGNQEFAAQLTHSPRSEAEGGMLEVTGAAVVSPHPVERLVICSLQFFCIFFVVVSKGIIEGS
jgi:hypothetical protein